MKSITDATWKDAAIIEATSLIARLETASIAHPELNTLTRQAVKLSNLIERIDEKPTKTRRH